MITQSNKCYLGLDIGDKTIGIAISQGFIANPLTTLRFAQYDFLSPVLTIAQLCTDKHVTDIVVGYPISLSGQANQRTKVIDDIISLMQNHCSKDVRFHKFNEQLTTKLAHQYMLSANLSRQKRKSKKDTLAAQIILNDFLKSQLS